MGLLFGLYEKWASAEEPPQAVLPPVAPPPPVAEWHSAWAPEAGWKSPENPEGWKRPQKEGQRKELFLWDQWNRGGKTPELTEPLLKSLRPVIYKQGVQQWADRVPIQKPVLESKATQLAIKGLHTYDPTQGQLNTHLTNQLKSMFRFARQRQNATRITEDRIGLIGPYRQALARLTDKLEREPTVLELADEMKVPVKTVQKLLLEMKDDLLASGATEDPFIDDTPESRLKLQLIRYSLTPDEEKVFDYLTGQGGKPLVTRPGEIARREHWAPSKVSQLKSAIAKKWKAAS